MKASFLILLIIIGAVFIQAGEVERPGTLTREDILRSCPEWEADAAAYAPDPGGIEKLRDAAVEVRIDIYLGTWCPDSKTHVSGYFKVMDLVDSPLYQTVYIGIPRDETLRESYVAGKDIHKLPTFVVTVNGQNKGRIIETPGKSIEEDLLAIIER